MTTVYNDDILFFENDKVLMDVKKCCESDVFFWFVHSVKSVFARRGKYRYSLK